MPDKEATTNPKNELEKCQKERDEHLDGWKRAKADFINYKKDEAKRLEEIIKFSNEDLIRELLAVVDSFTALDKAMSEKKDLAGVKAIYSQLENVLQKRGLKKIEAPAGQKFDPSTHESLEEIESEHPPGTIAEEIDSGWMLHDKVIRATKVKISKQKK